MLVPSLLLLASSFQLYVAVTSQNAAAMKPEFMADFHNSLGPPPSDLLQQQQQQQHRMRRSDFVGDEDCVVRQEVDGLKALLQQQAATILSLQNRLQGLEATLQHAARADQQVGFYADFGHYPFHDVVILPNNTCKFDRVLSNEGGGYDPSTGVFTAPSVGLYSFSLHFVGGNHDDMTNLAIVTTNQTVAVAFTEGHQRDSNDQGSCSAVLRLDKGQEVSVTLEYGNPLIWGSNLASFSGFLVHADPEQ